jgi:hypothetical protein
MSRSKHTEAQIIAALKQVEAGRTTEDAGADGARRRAGEPQAALPCVSGSGPVPATEEAQALHAQRFATQPGDCR